MRKRLLKIGLPIIALAITTASCSGSPKQARTPENGSGLSGSLRVGQAAPEFSLPSATGSTVTLSSFQGHRPVLLYFSMGPG
jgi:hypothetical protein